MIEAQVHIDAGDDWEAALDFQACARNFEMLKKSIRVQAGERVAGSEYRKTNSDGTTWLIIKQNREIGNVKIKWRFA